MARALTPFGLALFAALALSMTATSIASAQGFDFAFENNHVILKGAQHEGETAFKFEWAEIKCKSVSYEGTMLSETKTATAMTVAPQYEGCRHATIGVGVLVDMNGCHYVFHTKELEKENFEGSMEIACPEGKRIELTGFNCTITVLPQSGLSKVTYTNKGKGSEREVTIDFSLAEITYEQHKIGGGLGCTQKTVLLQDGTLKGAATFSGFSTAGEPIGFWVEKTE